LFQGELQLLVQLVELILSPGELGCEGINVASLAVGIIRCGVELGVAGVRRRGNRCGRARRSREYGDEGQHGDGDTSQPVGAQRH